MYITKNLIYLFSATAIFAWWVVDMQVIIFEESQEEIAAREQDPLLKFIFQCALILYAFVYVLLAMYMLRELLWMRGYFRKLYPLL